MELFLNIVKWGGLEITHLKHPDSDISELIGFMGS
jgi:hypothetical protein